MNNVEGRRTESQPRGPEVLVLYLERPRAKNWEFRRCVGALQIQRLEGSRPGDYGICFSMRRSLSIARWLLLSMRFRVSCWWQREWS